MSKLGQAIVLMLLIAVVAPPRNAIGKPKQLKNKESNSKTFYWVSRQANRAVVIQIWENPGSKRLEANLWEFKKVQDEYEYEKTRGPIHVFQWGDHEGQEGALTHEICEFRDEPATVKLRVGVFKHVKKNGQGNFSPAKGDVLARVEDLEAASQQARTQQSGSKKGKDEEKDCPPVPDDDVLEEEDLGDPGATPPEYPDIEMP